MSFATAAARLRGLVRGAFRGIEVLRRGYSPRILAAYVLGSAGRTEVSGPELQARLGLDDTWAYFSVRTARGVQAEPDLSHYVAPPAGTPPSEAPVAPEVPAGGVPAGGAPPGPPAPTPTPTGPEGGTVPAGGAVAGEGGGTTPP